MSKKLTDWFASGTRPSLIGVYQTRGGIVGNMETYQHWNGKVWGYWGKTPSNAEGDAGCESMRQDPEWRGLANPPKEAK